MKKFLLGAAAALAISAPGIAAAQSGYVDASYHTGEAEVAGVEGDADGWSAGGAVAFGGNGALGFQLDGIVSNTEADGGGEVDTYSVGGHVFSRSEAGLIGGFASFGNFDVEGLGDADVWTVGAEGQLYLSRTTLDGALSYSEGEDAEAELTAADVGVTHFISDNFSLGGNLGFGNIDIGADDGDILTYGLGAEYQLAAAPLSIFGGWQHAEIDDADTSSEAFSLGVRWNFGSGSLFERNRSGASLARGGGLGRYAGLL